MTATLMLGKPVADRIRAEVADEVHALGHVGLVTVLVGDDPASEIYIRLKHQAAVDAGIDATDLRLPAEISEADLLARIAALNVGELDRLRRTLGPVLIPVQRWLRWLARNTPGRSRRRIEAHYDLGNELFELFLDRSMT